MSTGWVTVVLCITALLLIFSNITYLAAASRDLFAFARDKGLLFSSWLSMVDKCRPMPTNACILTCGISICLGLIYIGSIVAFYAIISLFTAALLQCCCLSIGCLLWCRINLSETLPPAQFSLGNFGTAINALAVTYAVWAYFWGFWPQMFPVTKISFNWASVIFVAVLILVMAYYGILGRKQYTGPVTLVEGRRVRT